jgi:dihydroneopterin aldolase/D-erythro-7,8-dihydroneopterin triphosphate epimerase
MADAPLDRIHIRDLLVRCILGIYPDERREKQDVIVNITLYADLRKACLSDDIDDTVDYKTIKKNVLHLVQQSEYFLVERLAERIAELALETAAVQRVDVSVDKPGALRFARSVAVEISRLREG